MKTIIDVAVVIIVVAADIIVVAVVITTIIVGFRVMMMIIVNDVVAVIIVIDTTVVKFSVMTNNICLITRIIAGCTAVATTGRAGSGRMKRNDIIPIIQQLISRGRLW